MNGDKQSDSYMTEKVNPFTRMELGDKNIFDEEWNIAVDYPYMLEAEGASMKVLDALRIVSNLAKKHSIDEADAYIVCPQLIPAFKIQQEAFKQVDTFVQSLTNLKNYLDKRSNENG